MAQDLTKLYQHGTLAMLVPGLFEGTMSLGDLLKHGDTGIGTATGLGGEMIVLDGKAYLVKSSGEVLLLPDKTQLPFATVHFADHELTGSTVQNLTEKQLGDKILAENALQNVFFAVQITGTFSQVKTRAVAEQKRPYPPLSAVADRQAIFTEEDSVGTVVGYFSPYLFQGMASAGFHLHYLNDTKTLGGHLLDFTVKEAELTLQPFASVEQHFPLDNQEFMEKEFDLEKMNEEIQRSES